MRLMLSAPKLCLQQSFYIVLSLLELLLRSPFLGGHSLAHWFDVAEV